MASKALAYSKAPRFGESADFNKGETLLAEKGLTRHGLAGTQSVKQTRHVDQGVN